jgi:hypothetical protein
MKFFITIAIFFSFNFSVNAQENIDSLQNAFNPEIKKAFYMKNKTIVFNTKDSINPEFEVVNGNELVFKYEFRSKEYLMMSDDEYVERLFFKVKPKGNHFVYKLNNFKKSNLLYSQSCFCMDAGNYVIQKGRIVGTKLNKNTWKVYIKFSYIARNSKNLVNKTYHLKYKIAAKDDN